MLKISFNQFTLIAPDGTTYERDEAAFITNEQELESAIFQLACQFRLAQQRGDPILFETWSPSLSGRETQYCKDIFQEDAHEAQSQREVPVLNRNCH